MWDKSKHFIPEEVLQPYIMSESLLRMLNELREEYGSPISITSSWRPSLADKRSSAHEINSIGRWEGVDIACHTSRERYYLLKAAYKVGFMRIGVYDRHIHLDVSAEHAQDVCWVGVSK